MAETQVADDIDLTAPAGYELLGVSAQRGTGDEQVETAGLARNTDYYVRITGYQGAVSAQPYALRVKFTAPSLIDGCTGDARCRRRAARLRPSRRSRRMPRPCTSSTPDGCAASTTDRGLAVDGDAVLSSLQALVDSGERRTGGAVRR